MTGTLAGTGPRLIVRENGTLLRSRVSWSPDSRQLVYSRRFLGDFGSGPLAVVGSTGGTPVPITTDEGAGTAIDEDPDWSPAGDRIAFARWRPEGPGSGLAIVPPTGGRATLLVSAGALGIEEPGSTPPVEWPSWSPDGGSLAFMVRRDEDLGIYVVGSGGGAARRIATGAYPAWSPDGKLIAFRAGEGVSVVRPDGTGLRVVKADFPAVHLSWQAATGKPPNVASVRVLNPVVYLDPTEARIEREERRGQAVLRRRSVRQHQDPPRPRRRLGGAGAVAVSATPGRQARAQVRRDKAPRPQVAALLRKPRRATHRAGQRSAQGVRDEPSRSRSTAPGRRTQIAGRPLPAGGQGGRSHRRRPRQVGRGAACGLLPQEEALSMFLPAACSRRGPFG